MNNVEIDKLKETLKEYADYAIKLVKENKRLQQENKQLKSILTELEEYIGQEWYCFDNESIEFEVAKDILNKIQELKEKYI